MPKTAWRRAALLALAIPWAACIGRAADAGARDLGRYARIYDDDAMQAADQDYERECRGRADGAWPGSVPVNLADGVDRCEAQAIADEHIGELGCGAVGPPHDDGSRWVVAVRVGFEGRPLAPVQIDKRSGQVTGGPPARDLPIGP